MRFEEFTGQVQNLAQLGSKGEATEATRAVLITLGERLKGDEPLNVASQLPRTIKEYLTDSTGAGTGEAFSADEFVRRVAHRAGSNEPEARLLTQAVFQVLRQTVSDGEWRDMMGQIPNEYSGLFQYVEPADGSKKRQSKQQSTTGRQSLRVDQQPQQVEQPQPVDQPQPVETVTPWQPTGGEAEWQQGDTGVF